MGSGYRTPDAASADDADYNCTMASTMDIIEADILEKVVFQTADDLTPEGARLYLSFKFDRVTTNHIRQLLRKNNRGTISTEERISLEKYLRVGQFLDLLHAKARLRLRNNSTTDLSSSQGVP
jgi:hypothetical protein